MLSDHVSPNVLAVNKRKSILQYASTTSTHHPKNNSFTLFFPTLSSSKSWVNAPVCACPPSVDTTLDHDAHIAVDNNLSLQLLDLLFFGSVCWASIDHWFLPLHSSFYTLILQRWPRQVGSRQVIFAYRPLSFIMARTWAYTILLIADPLSDQAMVHLKSYKYQSVDKSFISNYILRHYVNLPFSTQANATSSRLRSGMALSSSCPCGLLRTW